jgi:Txe/YoeB family toxin of Txe-Axe toxin-antitoxin module
MTDPFSIIVGTAGLLDISVRVVKFLKKVQASDAKVEKSIAMLLHEIEALLLVNKTLEDFWTAKGKASLPTGLSDPNYVHDLWRNAGIILADCKNTVEKLEVLVKSIIGTVGIKVTGKIDSIKKQLRKESKEGDLEQLRRGLSRDQNILQLLLTALNL